MLNHRTLGRWTTLTAVVLAAWTGAVRADTFPAGSLIIPTSASYQDPCGMVSAYGLVYTVLRANDGLRAHPESAKGAWTAPITIHWVYNPAKSSPNRCVPTNLDVVYNGGSQWKDSSGNTAGQSSAIWNDGCDFNITNTGGVPVALISTTSTTTDYSTWRTYATNDTNGQALAFPNYASTLVRSTASPSTNVSTIQYSGGAFVIGATDANAFRYLLSTSSTVAVDKDNNPISFQAFATSSSAATCNWSSSGGKATFSSGENGNAYANVHHVNIHKALVQFSANDSQRMNGSPPRIGLIQTVGHDYADEHGYSVLTLKARNDLDPMSTSTTSTTSTIVGTPTGIKGAQLVYYLKSAGLDFVGAGGCPASSVNKGYTAVQPSNYNSKTGYTWNWNMCPAGAGVSGQIYDNLDVIDVANNIINQTDASGRPLYSVVWAPHWEGRPWRLSSTSSAADTCDRTCINKALGNIGTFLDDTNNSRGFLAECASIGLLEGAVWKDEVDSAIANSTTYDVACNPGYKTSPSVDTTSSNPSYCHPNERWVTATSSTASLTCPIANPNCTGYTTNPGTTLVHDVASGGSLTGIRLDNCTDPTKASGSKCVNYAQPGNSFSQIGDYRWFSYTGGVANYWPLASSTTYSSSGSVLPLLFTVASNDVTKNNTTLRGAAVADNATFIQRRNDKRKASIVYLAGHNYTPDVAGTRIALNTVLSLGFVVDVKESTFVGPTIFNTTSNPVVASSAQAAVGTYFRILSQGVSDQFRNYTPGQAAVWQFPYHTGNLRIHNLASLSAGANAYGGTSLQYSAVLPLPGSRNLFTYLGGQVTNDSSQLLSSTGATLSSYTAAYGVGVAQVGWSPESFDASTLTSASCVDQYSIVSTSSTVSGAYLGMQGNSPDGVCDLQEALELTLGKADVVDSTHNPNDFLATSELQKAQWMVQMIRGYCYATNKITGAPILSPTAADCDLSSADNTASLGGIVHSQPAIIGPSSLIPEAPSTKHRPWVAYVGGLDGQLHAFYIASDLNDIGYTGPATAITTVNASASTKFKTSFGSVFVPPVSGTELWAFIPPGQLPLLKTNAARVDASPAVADVFGDFNGSGTRTWHTVLVASAGDSNREIFALDITNPLKPSLLWDIESSYDSTLTYAPVPLQDTDIGYTATGRAQAFNWQNACRTGSSGCSQANYVLPPGTDPGRSTGGLFNYSHLGASQSVSIGTLRRNNAPVFAAFVATNEPGGNGIYVFAIDVVTGAKLWEWNNPYDASYNLGQGGTLALKGQGTGNTSPAGVSILSRSLDDQINSVYVGDDEGSLWELDASDGISNTGYASKLTGCSSSSTNTCNYKLSDAFGDGSHSAQPISTLSTIFVVRPDIPSANLFSPYANQVLLAYGTAGTDTVAAMPATTSTVSGAVHVLPLGLTGRVLPSDLKSDLTGAKLTHIQQLGAAYEVGTSKNGTSPASGSYPLYLSNGDRVYGSIIWDEVNGRLLFGTTSGSVTDIDKRGTESGNIYSIDTMASAGSEGLTKFASNTGGIGGTLAYDADSGTVLASTDQSIYKVTGSPTSPNKVVYSVDGTDSSAQGLLGWILRRSGREY